MGEGEAELPEMSVHIAEFKNTTQVSHSRFICSMHKGMSSGLIPSFNIDFMVVSISLTEGIAVRACPSV